MKTGSPFLALQYFDFRLLWFGSFVSQMGTQMQIVAVTWQLYEITKSPISLGFLGLAQFIPVLLFSMVGGIAADRVNRKKLLVFSQLFLAFTSAALSFISLEGFINAYYIYGVMAATAVANSFNMPARQSILPHLVPKKHFMNAVSLNTLQRQAATIIGPTIAGFAIASLGVESVYIFNTITFLVLICTLLPLHIPAHVAAKRASFTTKSVMEGVNFVRSSPILLSTMLLDFAATFFGTATILMPIFAADVLKIGVKGLGLLYSATSIGGIIAGLVLSSIHNLPHQGMIIIGSVLVYGFATIGFGLTQNVFMALIFLALTGAGDMVSTILRNTIRQMVTPDHIRGRMIAVNMIFVQGGPKLGEVEAGLLAALVGAPMSVVIGGVGVLAVTVLIAYFTPKLRKYQGDELAV